MRMKRVAIPPRDPPETEWKDTWAAILFAGNVLGVAALAGTSVASFAFADATNSLSQSLSLLVILSLACFAMGTLLLNLFLAYSSALIYFMLIASVVITAAVALYLMITGFLLGGILFAASAVASYFYMQAVQSRILFASAVLNIACKSIQRNYSAILLTSLLLFTLTLLWITVWTTAFAGLFSSFHAKENSLTEWTELLFSLLSLLWGCQVLRSLLLVTVAGALASWWFEPSITNPVSGTFFRAISTSFGSICFGSLLVAVVQAVHSIVQLMRQSLQQEGDERRSGDAAESSHWIECLRLCLLVVLEQLLSVTESLMVYFNKYAFCYVAAYGSSFLDSGRRVISLFSSKGWLAVVNDSLVSNVLLLCVILMAITSSLVGIVVAFTWHDAVKNPIVLGGSLGFIVGAIMGSMISTALDSSVSMVFVCFAEGPLDLLVGTAAIHILLIFIYLLYSISSYIYF